MSETLQRDILMTVMSFGNIHLDYLALLKGRGRADVEAAVKELELQGKVKLEGEEVVHIWKNEYSSRRHRPTSKDTKELVGILKFPIQSVPARTSNASEEARTLSPEEFRKDRDQFVHEHMGFSAVKFRHLFRWTLLGLRNWRAKRRNK